MTLCRKCYLYTPGSLVNLSGLLNLSPFLVHLDLHLHQPGVGVPRQSVGDHAGVGDQAPGLLPHVVRPLARLVLTVERRHGRQQNVRDVPPHLVTQLSEGGHGHVHRGARHRHQLDPGQGVEALTQLASVVEIKEGGEVQQQEEGAGVVSTSHHSRHLVPLGDGDGLSLYPVPPGLGGGGQGNHLRQERIKETDHLGVFAGQVVELHRVLQHAALLAVPGHHVDDVHSVHEAAKLVHQPRRPAAVSHEGAQEKIKLPALQHQLPDTRHEEVVPVAAPHVPQEVEVLQRLLGVSALKMFDIKHQKPREIQPPGAASVAGLLAEQGRLDVWRLTEKLELKHHEGDVGGVRGETLPRPEQEVDGGLELASEEQHLEVEDRLAAGGEVRLAILLAHQRLEAGQSEAVSAAVLPDQAQLEPEIVIQTGDHLAVLVLDVRGPEDAVDCPLVGVSGLATVPPVLQPHLILCCSGQSAVCRGGQLSQQSDRLLQGWACSSGGLQCCRDVATPETVEDHRPDGDTIHQAVIQPGGGGGVLDVQEGSHQAEGAWHSPKLRRAEVAVHNVPYELDVALLQILLCARDDVIASPLLAHLGHGPDHVPHCD